MRVGLASYPRSGNHLLRAYLEFLLGVESKGVSPEDTPIFARLKDLQRLPALADAPTLIKTHRPEEVPTFDALVFVTRDPLEAIGSHMRDVFALLRNQPTEKDFAAQLPGCVGAYWEQVRVYQALLNAFKAFRGPKVHVRYEALLDDVGRQHETWALICGVCRVPRERLLDLAATQKVIRDATVGVLLRPAASQHSATFYADKHPWLTKWAALQTLREARELL